MRFRLIHCRFLFSLLILIMLCNKYCVTVQGYWFIIHTSIILYIIPPLIVCIFFEVVYLNIKPSIQIILRTYNLLFKIVVSKQIFDSEVKTFYNGQLLWFPINFYHVPRSCLQVGFPHVHYCECCQFIFLRGAGVVT
jgi:hypothetical protein